MDYLLMNPPYRVHNKSKQRQDKFHVRNIVERMPAIQQEASTVDH